MEEDLADLYENAPCGYLSLCPNRRVVKINHTLADWLGAGAETLLNRPFHDLLSFGGRIAFETHMAPLLRLQGHVNELALDMLQADGSKLPVIANAAEKRGSNHEHLFTRLTIFKAVERRAYERDLVAARTQAEASAATAHDSSVLREQFIAVLGHDLRNPLAALAAGIRLIERREVLSSRGQFIVKEMNASVTRATELVDNVLDFARGRLGNGLTLARNAGQPLTPVLEQVVGELRSIAPNRRIEAHFSIGPCVDCDPGRIGQLASNLIANAVAHGAPEFPIVVEAHTDDSSFHLSVANGGAPIPEAARALLFQPFFRGAVRRSQQGLGLGLFIVNQIAKAHGGSMTVVSTEQETRFTFSMPLSSA